MNPELELAGGAAAAGVALPKLNTPAGCAGACAGVVPKAGAVDAAADPKGDAAAELPNAGAAFAAGAAAPPPKLKGFAGVDELVPN